MIFQPSPSIADYNISPLNGNETTYSISHWKPLYATKIDDPNFEIEGRICTQNYHEMAPLISPRILEPQENTESAMSCLRNQCTLSRRQFHSKNTRADRRQVNRSIRSDRDRQRIDEPKPNRPENRNTLDQRIRRNRLEENSSSRLLTMVIRDSVQSVNSRRFDARERFDTLFLKFDSKSRNSKSIEARDQFLSKLKRRTSQPERIETSRRTERFLKLIERRSDNYGRSIERGEARRHLEARNEIFSRLVESKTNGNVQRVVKRSNRENFDSATSNSLTVRNTRSSQNTFFNMFQYTWLPTGLSLQSDERGTQHMHENNVDTFRNTITYREYHATQNSRYSAKSALNITPLKETQSDTLSSRQFLRATNRMRDSRRFSARDNGLVRETCPTRYDQRTLQQTLALKPIKGVTISNRAYHNFLEKSQNRIALNKLIQRHISEGNELNTASRITFKRISSKTTIRDIQTSRQTVISSRIESNVRFERLLDKRVNNLGKSHNGRQYSRYSVGWTIKPTSLERVRSEYLTDVDALGNSFLARLSERTIRCNRLLGNTLNEQKKGSILSVTPLRRQLNNRLPNDTPARRLQFRESSERSQLNIHSGQSIESIHHSRNTERLANSRVLSRIYPEKTTDETRNVFTNLCTNIRSNQYLLDQSVIRTAASLAQTTASQDRLRKNHRGGSFEERSSSISRISNGRTVDTFRLKRNNFRNSYAHSEIVSLPDASIKLTNHYREYSEMRNSPKGKISLRIEPIVSFSHQQYQLKSPNIQTRIYNLPTTMIRHYNDDAISEDQSTSLETRYLIPSHQRSSIKQGRNVINRVRDIVGSILKVISVGGFNSNSLRISSYELKREVSTVDHIVMENVSWKQGFKTQDAVVAGLGIFAALQLRSVKSIN